MNNFLSKQESEFFNEWCNEQEQSRYNLLNYFRAMIVPFSSNSFDINNFLPYLNNLKADGLDLLSPLTLYFLAFRDFGFIRGALFGTLDLLIVPFLYAALAIDITLQVTTLALGLLTRSLATLIECVRFKLTKGPEDDEITWKLKSGDGDNFIDPNKKTLIIGNRSTGEIDSNESIECVRSKLKKDPEDDEKTWKSKSSDENVDDVGLEDVPSVEGDNNMNSDGLSKSERSTGEIDSNEVDDDIWKVYLSDTQSIRSADGRKNDGLIKDELLIGENDDFENEPIRISKILLNLFSSFSPQKEEQSDIANKGHTSHYHVECSTYFARDLK